MCGIAGLIHRGKSSNVGEELQNMLQALKHRGPDSTGYALYANNDGQNFILRFKVGENVGEGSAGAGLEQVQSCGYDPAALRKSSRALDAQSLGGGGLDERRARRGERLRVARRLRSEPQGSGQAGADVRDRGI